MFSRKAEDNLGHVQWELAATPVNESNAESKVFWRCCSCGVVVGFWLEGHGSQPTSIADIPPDNVGVYSGKMCGT